MGIKHPGVSHAFFDMRFLRPLLILSLLPAAAMAEVPFGESQGSFSVFGPSADRESFFAEQEAARDAALEAQRQERERERARQAELQRLETMREIAEADARARERQARTRLLPCVIAVPDGPKVPGRSLPVPRNHRDTRITRTMPPLDPGPGRPGPFPTPPTTVDTPRHLVPCRPAGTVVLPYRPLHPYGSELSVTVDEDGFTGSVTLRRPGVGFGFGF